MEQLIGSALVDGQIVQLIEEENETTIAIVTRISRGSMIVHPSEEKKGGRVAGKILAIFRRGQGAARGVPKGLEFANGLADRARMVARIVLRSWALRSNDGGNEGGETRVMVTKLTRLQRSIIRLLGVDPRTYGLA